jgi:hypothetical protein
MWTLCRSGNSAPIRIRIPSLTTHNHRADWLSSNALDSYSGGFRFESRAGHRLSCWGSQLLKVNARQNLEWATTASLQISRISSCNYHATIRRNIVCLRNGQNAYPKGRIICWNCFSEPYFRKHVERKLWNKYWLKLKLNSVAFSPQANYTDRATAACRRS